MVCLMFVPTISWAQAPDPPAGAQPQAPAEPAEPEPRSFSIETEPPTLEFATTPPASGIESEQDEAVPPADPEVATVLGAETPSGVGVELRIAAAFAAPTFATGFSETYDTGYQFGLELNFRLERLFLGGAVYHSGLFFRRESLLDDERIRQATQNLPPDAMPEDQIRVNVEGGTLLLFEILGLARYELTDKAFRPYVLVGGGVTISQPTELTASVTLPGNNVLSISREQDLRVDPTVTAGFGVTERLGPFDLFAQVRGGLLLLGNTGFLTSISVGAAVSP